MTFLHFAWVGGNSAMQVLSGPFVVFSIFYRSALPLDDDDLFRLQMHEISVNLGPPHVWLWLSQVYVC